MIKDAGSERQEYERGWESSPVKKEEENGGKPKMDCSFQREISRTKDNDPTYCMAQTLLAYLRIFKGKLLMTLYLQSLDLCMLGLFHPYQPKLEPSVCSIIICFHKNNTLP